MSRKLRLIFMGTPEFAVPTLEALVKAGHDIIAVYTQPPRPSGRGLKETPSPVHQFALAHNLTVFTPLTLKDSDTQHRFREHRADAAIVAAYGLLLPKQILEAPAMGCLNVHPSLLPRWRGAAPIQRTIMAGDRETGVGIMQMDAGLDTGDVLDVQPFSIPDGMNAGELHDTLSRMAAPLMVATLDKLAKKDAMPVKQPDEGVTYAHKITKEECRIDWQETAHAIRNKILGLAPAPGAFFMYQGEAIKVLNASLLPDARERIPPGTVLDDQFSVACGEGILGKMLLRRPGKNLMPASEMLKGFNIKKGEKLA